MARKLPTVLFPNFAPDMTDLGTNTSVTISGCLPKGDGYGPFQSFVAFTAALPANCRGFFFARNTDGSIAVFAGTSTNLYELNNTTFQWMTVSKGGSSYPPLVANDNWQFAQFNSLVIAVQINSVPQKFLLGSSTQFADLGGSPPQASHIAIVNFFVVLTGLLSNPNRAQWSDLDAPETWTAGVGLADFQDFPDGGVCHAIAGGDAYGVIFQDEVIRTMTYAPGSPVVFQITRISTQDTLFAQYSVINAGTRVFFISAQGFKVIVAGGNPVSIGKEIVDQFFFGDVDRSALPLIIGAADPNGTRVYWPYKSKAGQAGLFDKILCFDWSIGSAGEWSLIPMSGQYLGYLAKPGLTLEQMDAIAPGALAVTNAVNNGSGNVRLTLSPGVTNGPFTIVGQNSIEIQNIVGTTEANGAWFVQAGTGNPAAGKFTIIDATHIDVGVAFVHAYVSGGAIGGSLDAIGFSLDSISNAAVAQLAAVGPGGQLGFFTGENIEAILETPEQDSEGAMIMVNSLRPLTDSPDVVASVGWRMTAQAPVNYTAETALNQFGECPVTPIEARYAKARARIPAGSVWTYARGMQPDVMPAGDF